MNMGLPRQRLPSLAQRALELSLLGLPDSSTVIRSGTHLLYRFSICPSTTSRVYECLIKVWPGKKSPEAFVVFPDLSMLAAKRLIPHVYPHKGAATKLCLWCPKLCDWNPELKLTETYIPWIAEWLWYFEDWLYTGEWAGGGRHPDQSTNKRRRS